MTTIPTDVTMGAKPRWTRLATLGFLFAAASPLILLFAVLVWGLNTEGETAFFLILAGIALVAAFIVNRFGTWAKIVGAVLALLMMAGLWWTAFGLFAPGSFFEFLSGLLLIPGAILALISCIGAIVAKRRGHVTTAAEEGERKAIRTAFVVVGLAAVVSGVMTVTSRSSVGEAEAASAAATARMKDFEFAPVEYSVAGGSTILVRNDDPFFHTFTVDALGIDESLTPGSEKLVTIPSRPGTYVLYCEPHTEDKDAPEGDDMFGQLVVT